MENEKMINGILHYYNESIQTYVPYTIQALSTAFVAMRHMYEDNKVLSERQDKKLSHIKSITNNQ
jgi:hypothetical protein